MTMVSVVVPTYDDDPEHVREAVASALTQTYSQVEVIVVADGSTPAVEGAALNSLGPVTLLRQENAGPSAARNAGVRAAQGGLIICVDADDVLSPTYAAEGVCILTDDSRVSAAYSAVEPFGDLTSAPWPTRGVLRLEDFAQRSAVPVSSMFRRRDWERVGGFDETMRTGMEDHEWWIRLLGATGGTAAPMPTAVLRYRIRPASRSKLRAYADDLAVTRSRILANNPPPVLGQLLVGAWAATDAAEAEAARAWSDPWQLRRWGRALRRRLKRLRSFAQRG